VVDVANFSVQIQIKANRQFQFVPQDTEETEFRDLVDFENVAFVV